MVQNGVISRGKSWEKFEMKSLCLNHHREKSTGFHIIQMKFVFMNSWIWDMHRVFSCLKSIFTTKDHFGRNCLELHLLQRPKKHFSALRASLHDWRKIGTIETKHMKKKVTGDSKLTLFWYQINFVLSSYTFFRYLYWFVNWFLFSLELSAFEPKLSFKRFVR